MFDLMTSVLEQTGYIGITLLMLLENVFPPIPSEFIMPLAGFTAARGQFNILLVVVAGTVGSLAGAIFWYGIGRWLGGKRLRRLATRHGRWLTVGPSGVDEATEFFQRHSGKSVFLGRLIPAVRTLISVPAAIAGMPLGKFIAYTALGTGTWTSLLAGGGYLLEDHYQNVSSWVNLTSNVILGLIMALYIYRLIVFHPQESS
jgi:membrane protein DedA with SNARE-associated domain